MADQKIVTETALSAFASDVKGELISKIGYNELPSIIDNEPYNFRPTANGKGVGDRETDKLIGGTLAFNQVVNKDKFISKTTSDYTSTPNGDGSLSVVIINTLASETTVYLTSNLDSSYFKVPYGHKYAMIDANNIPSGVSYRNGMDSTAININTVKTQNRTDGSIFLGLFLPSGLTAQTFKISPMIIDLTQMFGSTIADYIYSLEQGTAGAGVAYFRKLFPKPYYAYNAGELMSVKTSAHRMVGFNQWDEQMQGGSINTSTGAVTINPGSTTKINTNKLYVLPNTRYNMHKENNVQFFICFYNANDEVIQYVKEASDTGSAYNMSCLCAANNQNTVFTTPTGTAYIYFRMDLAGATPNNVCINLSCPDNGTYEPYEVNEYALDSNLELRGIPKLDANNNLYYDGDTYESDGTVTRYFGKRAYQSGDESLTDAITDGTNTVYKLTTPTAETADAYQNPQICDGYGTEEYVDDRNVAVPVGHVTEYVKNMDRLLLPATPSADGTYTLKCTVSGGTPTLSWVADT